MTDDSTEASTSLTKTTNRKAVTIIGCVLALTLCVGLIYLYFIGRSTLSGWHVIVDSLPDSIITPPQQLPGGSRVVFEDTKVATLTIQKAVPRQQGLGGELLLIEGYWNPEGRSGAAISDSTLIGILSTDVETRVVEIELTRLSTLPSKEPVGLLRLRPFRHGYRVYTSADR